MYKPESFLEQILFSTVRIENIHSDGSESCGTAFIFNYHHLDKDYLFLVTNKHVIKDSKNGSLAFNLEREENVVALGKKYLINFQDFENYWYKHPSDDIDIAIMPFGPILTKLDNFFVQIYFKSIPNTAIPSEKIIKEEIDAIEDIIFIGYPNNIYDKINLTPVVRKGITATPFPLDFEEKPIFLIDASIFPGSSGSPVFLCNVGSFSPKGKGLKAGSRIFFLGIVSSVFIKREFNTIELIEIPTNMVPVVAQDQMIDLGIVFKSSLIEQLIKDFLVEKGAIQIAEEKNQNNH